MANNQKQTYKSKYITRGKKRKLVYKILEIVERTQSKRIYYPESTFLLISVNSVERLTENMNLLRAWLKDKMIKEQNGMKRKIADLRIQIESQNNTITDLINNKDLSKKSSYF